MDITNQSGSCTVYALSELIGFKSPTIISMASSLYFHSITTKHFEYIWWYLILFSRELLRSNLENHLIQNRKQTKSLFRVYQQFCKDNKQKQMNYKQFCNGMTSMFAYKKNKMKRIACNNLSISLEKYKNYMEQGQYY